MHLTSVDLAAKESKRYSSIGCCIYCGDIQDKLGDEHIIPYGLVGNAIVFERASCNSCAKETGRFEQIVLRTCLGIFRARIEAPTRRPKERPESVVVKLLRIDAATKKVIGEIAVDHIPIGNFPRVFAALKLPPPGLVLGHPPGKPVRKHYISIYDPEEMKEFFHNKLPSPASGEGLAFKIGDVNMPAFMRMLAKIGHAYAVAEVGKDKFKPLLLDIIFGRNDDYAYLIGGDEDAPTDREAISMMREGEFYNNKDNKNYLIIGFDLWPSTNAPQYTIVVGEI